MKWFSLLLSAGLVALTSLAPARPFTNTEGKSIEAEVVRATATSVTLRLPNTRTSTISLTTLSEADRAYVKDWLAKELPRLRFTPNMVRSNKDDRAGNTTYSKSERQIQSRSLSVAIVNDGINKGLAESTMKYILIGRSISKRDTYKILAVQNVDFTVPAGGRTTVPFQKIVSSYYDSQYSSSGYKVVGYVLFAERKSDKREVYTYASMPQFKNALYSIIGLPAGTVTNDSFVKNDVRRIGEDGVRPRRPDGGKDDVIVVE